MLSLRLPKWLYNPPVLTNLPFLPALDIGNPCSTGGVEGVCHSKAKCAGLGLTQAGYCTSGKSVCCTGRKALVKPFLEPAPGYSFVLLSFFKNFSIPEASSCNSSMKSSVSYFTSPQQLDGEKTCQSQISIQSNICYLR